MEIVIQFIKGLRVNKWTMWSESTRVRPPVIWWTDKESVSPESRVLIGLHTLLVPPPPHGSGTGTRWKFP